MHPRWRRIALALVVLGLLVAGTGYVLYKRGQLPFGDPLWAYPEPWPELPDPPDPGLDWRQRSAILREHVRLALTLPTERIPLEPIVHQQRRGDGFVVKSVSYASEPGSRITALLYLPDGGLPAPAVIIALGHGASKSALYGQYAGQLYAKMGFVCLVPDTIGEEERNVNGRMGTRAHDMPHLKRDYPEFVRTKLERMVMGKIVWDLIRGIDYLETLEEVTPGKIGMAGFSMGAMAAALLTMVDQRLPAAVICGWAFRDKFAEIGRYCSRMTWRELRRFLSDEEATALAAPHTATLNYSGDSEALLDPDEGGPGLVRDLEANVRKAKRLLATAGLDGVIETRLEPGADHRPLFLTPASVAWLQEHLMTPQQRRPIPQRTISFGDWVDSQGRKIERLYDTEARERGNRVADIGAVLYDPRDLACFPDRDSPPREYTMQGWVESQIAGSASAGR